MLQDGCRCGAHRLGLAWVGSRGTLSLMRWRRLAAAVLAATFLVPAAVWAGDAGAGAAAQSGLSRYHVVVDGMS